MSNWSKTPRYREGEKAKTWQKPKEDHPWRRYQNKKVVVEENLDIIPLREYLENLVRNWDSIEITTFGDMGDRTYTLRTASQKKSAAYIVGVLKRNYVQK